MNGTSLRGLVESLGAEGFYQKVCQLLNEKQVAVDDFSYYELAEACGVLPSLRSAGRRMGGETTPGAGAGQPGCELHPFSIGWLRQPCW